MSIKRKWLKLTSYGALWLTAATLLTKLIGVLQKIPLQNLAGDSVFGIYNIVYPIYQMMMALGIAGIPTALASYIAMQPPLERERTLRVGLTISSVASLIMAIIGFAAAPWLGSLIGHNEVVSSLRVLALALLITPLIAVYRGYYQGLDNAKTSSLSQLLEQLIRVACMVLLLWLGLKLDWSDATMSAAVMWGSVIGALATLLWFWQRKPKLPRQEGASTSWIKEGAVLLKLALPTALAAIVVPMVAVVDALTIPRLLANSGVQGTEAMAQFGQYSRIQPLIQLVSMLLAALAAGFLPRWVKQEREGIAGHCLGTRLLLMHRIALLISFGAAAGLYILSEPINIALYKDAAGIATFRLLAISTAASCVLAVQAPLLQGAGITRLSIWLVIIAAGSKALLNGWLVPIRGIEGAAIAANLSLLVPAVIGGWALYRTVQQMNGVPYNMLTTVNRELARPLLAASLGMLIMLAALRLLQQLWPQELETRLDMTTYILVAVAIGASLYGLAMLLSRAITVEELRRLG